MEQRYKLDFEVIGKRIKQGRKLIGITQSQLAERVHITTNQIAKLETNKTAASLESIVNIANVLQIDINALLMNEENEQTQGYIDLLIINQLKDFTTREKESLLLVINAMKICKSEDVSK